MYAYSEDNGGSWKNSEGQLLDGVPRLDSPGITVVDIPGTYGLMNTHGQTVDSRGRIHAVVWHCTEKSLAAAGSEPGASRWGALEARRYHHYWRDDSGEWQHRELPGISGNRPKVFVDKDDNAYLIFGRNASADEMNSEIYFAQGDLVIMAASSESQWRDWKVIHTEQGPFSNEMLYDFYRWKESGILSVMVQESSLKKEYASALRVLDFELKRD